MATLTDAPAVGEWHRMVRDRRIGAEVELEACRIEMAARERHAALSGEQVATRAEIAEAWIVARDAGAALDRARRGLGQARDRLEERRTGRPATGVGSEVLPRPEDELPRSAATSTRTARRSPGH
jgi:hypothetical protein